MARISRRERGGGKSRPSYSLQAAFIPRSTCLSPQNPPEASSRRVKQLFSLAWEGGGDHGAFVPLIYSLFPPTHLREGPSSPSP